jgi:hypothetical protein
VGTSVGIGIERERIAVGVQPRIFRIGQGAVGVERAVLDHRRNLVRIFGQVVQVLELALETVAQNIKTGEPGVNVQARDPQGVIVIPQRGAFLIVWIVIDFAAPARAFAREAGREPGFRRTVAVIGHMAAVQVRHGADKRPAERRIAHLIRAAVHRGIERQKVRQQHVAERVRKGVDEFGLRKGIERGLGAGGDGKQRREGHREQDPKRTEQVHG